MNVYDFDGTIYDGDSTLDFYFFCLRRHPKIFFCLPKQIYAFLQYKTKMISKNSFKEKFYSFLSKLNDIDSDISRFWQKNFCNIKSWYLIKKADDDLIISASPFFLLEPVYRQLHIGGLIASLVNKETGKLLSENCYGKIKVERFLEEYPKQVIDEFYSDSYSDIYMARLAKKAYLVKNNKTKQWKI